MIKKIFFLGTLITLLGLGIAAPALAQESVLKDIIPGGHLVPEECRSDATNTDVNQCGVSQMLQVVVNITQIILVVAGSAALLMFIYGGTQWIISGGSADKVEKGKETIKAAVIGLALILGGWSIINLFIGAFTGGEVGNGPAKIFNQPFDTEPRHIGPPADATPARVGEPFDIPPLE